MCGPIFILLSLIIAIFISNAEAQTIVNDDMERRLFPVDANAVKSHHNQMDLQSMPFTPQCNIGNCYYCSCIGKSEGFSQMGFVAI